MSENLVVFYKLEIRRLAVHCAVLEANDKAPQGQIQDQDSVALLSFKEKKLAKRNYILALKQRTASKNLLI